MSVDTSHPLWSILDENRSITSKPWSVFWNNEPWSLATNARVIALHPGHIGFSDAPTDAKFDHVFTIFPTSPPRPILDIDAALALAYQPVPVDDRPPCTNCENTGRVPCRDSDCEDGIIECECECGHTHERNCDACIGTGWVPCSCGRPAKTVERRPCRIGTGLFDLNEIARGLKYLPDGEVTFQHESRDPGRPGLMKPGLFRAGAWILGVMPLMLASDESLADVPQIVLGEMPAGVQS